MAIKSYKRDHDRINVSYTFVYTKYHSVPFAFQLQ